jgi:hypothetical protein
LREEANGVVHQEGAVSAMRESPEGCADDGCVPVVKSELGQEFMDNPKWDGSGAADHESYWYPLVSATKAEKIFGETAPCDRNSIVTLEHYEIINICPSLRGAKMN